MSDRRMTVWLIPKYGVAVIASTLAIFLWFVTGNAPGTPGESSGFLLFLLAVTVSSWYGGLGPGLVVSLCGATASLEIFMPSHSALSFAHPLIAVQLAIFVLIAGSITWINNSLRETQARLRRQLDFTNAITHNLGEGIYAVDARGSVTFLNPAAERILGYSTAELHGKDIHMAIHRCRRDDARLGQSQKCLLTAVPTAATTVRDEDDSFVRKDGQTIAVTYTSSPLLTRGVVSGGVVTFRDVTERKRTVDAMRATVEWHQNLVETSPDSIWLTDQYGFVTSANQQAANLYGFATAEEMIGTTAIDLYVPEDRVRVVQDRRRLIENGGVLRADYRSIRRDGTTFPAELSASVSLDEHGQVRALINVVRDVTERMRAEETLRSSEARLAMQYAATTVLAQSSTLNEAIPSLLQTICEIAGWDVGAFWMIDPRDELLHCRNFSHLPSVRVPNFKKTTQQLTFARGVGTLGHVWETGRPDWVIDVIDSDIFMRTPVAVKDGLHTAFCFPVMIGKSVHGIMEFFSFDVRSPNHDLIQATTTIGTEVGQFVERKQAEEALEYQALHDALTDLPNRTLLKDRMQQAVRSAERNEKALALLLMDLDHFKEVNDTFGHHYGDLLLQEVGSRIRSTLRDSDTVARLGGDEFAVLLPAVDAVGAQLAATKIVSSLEKPFVLEGRNFAVGCSIGIAVYPDHGENPNTLLRRADVAMYVAKRGNVAYSVYAADHDEYSPNRIALKSELRHAIETGQLVLHYQPKADIKTGLIDSVEALVRWQHPEHGLIPPDQFISLAEQAGLIGVLSLHVLSSALRQCRAWCKAGLDLSVAVNLSASNLQDEQLAGMIAGMLRTVDVPPHRLKVEITESAVMTDPDRALEMLTRLHNLGIKISIDDFGTGYSSLSYIRRLPADEIKIDKSFVIDMAGNEGDAFIVRSVIELGHNLGLQVVAEGVEDDRTLSILQSLGCDMAQGAYLSLAVPPAGFIELFNDRLFRLESVS